MPQLENQQLPAYRQRPQSNQGRRGINWAMVALVSSIIIFILIIAIFAYWFFVLRPIVESQPPLPTPPTEEASPSAEPATPSAKKDETADWKTFESSKYKYSIKHPPTWVVTNSDEESFVVRRAQGSFERVIVEVNVNTGFCEGGSAETKTIQVSGFEGTEYSCFVSGRTDPAEIIYLFKNVNGNQNYVIRGEIYAPGEELTNQLDTIKLMLSTFKFLD